MPASTPDGEAVTTANLREVARVSSWRTISVASLALLAIAIVLVPLATHAYAARRVRAALDDAAREAAVMREVYDYAFAFRSLQVNAQNILLADGRVADGDELRERYAISRDLVRDGIAPLAAIDSLWSAPGEADTLRTALDRKIAAFDAALAAHAAGDVAATRARTAESAADFGTRRIFGAMMGRQHARVEATTTSADAALKLSSRAAWWGAMMQGLMLALAAYTVWREVARRARDERAIAALNDTLAANVAQLSAANEELQSFSYHVAHDLRAPVRHISAHVARLQPLVAERGVDADAQAHDAILRAARRMGALIDGLLEYARLGRAELTRQVVDTHAVVAGLVAQESAAHPARRIEFHIDALPPVIADPVLVGSLFHNLVDNALKFTASRDVARIGVRAQVVDEGRSVRFDVSDNGIGFRREHGAQLFGMFRQLHGKVHGGSGVGLALVRRMAERMGGSVAAHGEEGRGATFSVTLPAAPRAGSP